MSTDPLPAYASQYVNIVSKAWRDPAFRDRLVAETMKVLAEEGFEVPDGMEVQAYIDTAERHHFVVPRPPDKMPDIPAMNDYLRCLIACGRPSICICHKTCLPL